VAIVSSYFMNRHWTYRDRDKSAAHRELFVFTPVPVAEAAAVLVPAQAGAIEQEFEDLLGDELDEELEHQLGRREVNPAPASAS
jgi:hypothetical protein